jgi:hypothetical protein
MPRLEVGAGALAKVDVTVITAGVRNFLLIHFLNKSTLHNISTIEHTP